MAQARRERYTCPVCGTVGLYPVGQMIRCKGCLTPAKPVANAPPVTPVAEPAAATEDPPVALAGIALACAIAALLAIWVLPLSFLLLAASLGLGIYALSNSRGDSGTLVMGGIAVALAVIALVMAVFLVSLYSIAAEGSSVEFSSSGPPPNDTSGSGGSGGSGGSSASGSSGSGGSTEPSPSGGSGGSGDSGGTSSGGSGGGSSGGGSGGGGSGGGGSASGGASAPAPAALLSGLVLLVAAAWRRRTGSR